MGTQINLGRALTAIEKTTRAGLTAETSSELRIDTVRRNEHQQVKHDSFNLRKKEFLSLDFELEFLVNHYF